MRRLLPLWLFATTLFVFAFAAAQKDTVLYLVGKVVMADGGGIPETLRVELYCEGKVVRQTFPNQEGVFSFDLGSRRQTQTVTDASAMPTTGGLNEGFARDAWNPAGFHTVLGRVYLDDCAIRLGPNAEYGAPDIQLGIRGLLDRPDVGVLIVKRGAPENMVVDATIPADAREAFEAASGDLGKKKPDRKSALKHLATALERYPNYARALALMGQLELELGRPEKASSDFEKAIALEPESVVALLGLSQLSIEAQEWEKAAELSAKVLAQEPALPRALLYQGLASYYMNLLGSSQMALEQLEQQEQIERFPIGLLHLGMIYARAGRLSEAAIRLERYIHIDHSSAERVAMVEKQLADWREKGLTAPSQ